MNFMNEALFEAQKAFDQNEIPIGAVIVHNGKIIAKAHNMCEKYNNPLMHAEIVCLMNAYEKHNTKMLDECEMYVTVEPCPMCAGAILNSRIKRLYIGCPEPKSGAFGSVINISEFSVHKCEVYFGFSEDESKNLMKNFFKNKR